MPSGAPGGGAGGLEVEVARGPGGDDLGGVFGIGRVGDEVVGVVEGDEALGVFRGREDLGRVVDADDRVARRMQDQKRAAAGRRWRARGFRPPRPRRSRGRSRTGRPPRSTSADAFGRDPVEGVGEVVGDVAGIEGRADGDDGRRTEAMPAAAFRTAAPPSEWPISSVGRHARAPASAAGGGDEVVRRSR